MRSTVFILLASLISSQAAGQNPHEGPFTGQGLARLMEEVCSAEIAAQTAQNLRSGDLAFFEGTEELLAIEETGSPPILISRTDLMGVHDSAGLQYHIGVIFLHQGFATYMGLTEQRNEDYVMSLALTRMCFLRKPPAVMIGSRDPSDEGEFLWLADVTNAFEVVWQRQDAPLIAALQPPLPLPQPRLRGYSTGASWGDLPAWLSARRDVGTGPLSIRVAGKQAARAYSP